MLGRAHVPGLPAATVPPVRVITPVPAVVVRVPAPHTFGVDDVATVRPVGSVSVKVTPVRATLLAAGFVIVKDRVVVLLTGIEAAPKVLLSEGGASTFRVANASVPVPPSVEVTFPVVLTIAPAVVPVTVTETVQLPPIPSVPPVKDNT